MKLTINKKAYPLVWGMGALEIFCDTMNCDLEDIDKALNQNPEQNKYLVNLILAALRNGSELGDASADFNISYRQLQNFLDEAPDNTLPNIMDDFKKSKYFGKTMADYLFAQVEEEDTSTGKKKSRLEK